MALCCDHVKGSLQCLLPEEPALSSFLWLWRPAAACCWDVPPRVELSDPLADFDPSFLWLGLPAFACWSFDPPRVSLWLGMGNPSVLRTKDHPSSAHQTNVRA